MVLNAEEGQIYH